MLLPAGHSCPDTCGTIDLVNNSRLHSFLSFGHIVTQNSHHALTCPIVPEICYYCSKRIYNINNKCIKKDLHSYMHV